MPGLKVCRFGHGERRGEARKQVAMVFAIGYALGTHEVLGRPDTLPGFLEVVHRLFEDGVFVGHDRSIRPGRGILRGAPAFHRFVINHVPIATLRAQERSETPSIPAILAQWALQ
jgi:hypothetical protein